MPVFPVDVIRIRDTFLNPPNKLSLQTISCSSMAVFVDDDVIVTKKMGFNGLIYEKGKSQLVAFTV